MKAILIDIDHTLSNATWRDYMIGTVSWDEYHMQAKDDKPIKSMIEFIRNQKCIYRLVGLTSRPEKWRGLTLAWLFLNDVQLDELLMRPDEDYKTSPDLKVSLALERFPNIKEEVAFVLDDRQDVVEAFRAMGVVALQVYT